MSTWQTIIFATVIVPIFAVAWITGILILLDMFRGEG